MGYANISYFSDIVTTDNREINVHCRLSLH